MKLCKCGCGKEVRETNIYIHGHNRAGMASYTHNDKWSMKYDRCVVCGTTELRHVGKGLCTKCHRKDMYLKKENGQVELWSIKYSNCIMCGTNKVSHRAKGLCRRCYDRKRYRAKGHPERKFGQWSWYYKRCVDCGTTEAAHVKNGLCYNCYEESKRDLSNCVICPVCGIKVNKLSQHMTMKAKKCNRHYNYQYELFKKYFDSDLSLKDISIEMGGVDRHMISRTFSRLFGKRKTKKRNEMVRRCNISEKAVINHNNKNRFGTIVEYLSPNQGTIKLRSKLEAKYAVILDRTKVDWYYESKSFPYLDKDGKRRTYTPDFYLTKEDKYIEIKGYKKDNDSYKINYLLNNGINIEMITQKDLKEIVK